MACGPFFFGPGSVRVYLHRGGIQRESLNLDTHDLLGLQLFKDAIQYAILCPAIHTRINTVPFTESGRKTAPFAALLGNIQDGVEDLQIRQTNISSLHWQAIFDLFVLLNRDFHL
jgi:hypothetical protein